MPSHDVLLDLPSQRLALALLHFLWQGTLIAAVYSVAVEWFIRRPPRRYAVGVTAIAAMAACLPITYWLVELPPSNLIVIADPTAEARATVLEGESPDQSFVAVSAPMSIDELNSIGQFTVQLQAEKVADQTTNDRAELYGRIVLVWLFGVVTFSLRLVSGAVGLRLLTSRTSPAPSEFSNLMERFGRAMRLGRLPRLVVSSRVSEAIASGFFRPVIVFPAAWLAELPPSVIEAVLAHELAHVRRYDLWVNLLQRAVEAVLFFHPAVWWISRQVRSDREMCCDELAVAATGQKLAYVSALEVVARRAAREPLFSLAPGIGGRKMHLLARVRHVLGLPTQRQPGGWWTAGVLALAVPCGLWALSGPAAPRALAQEERDEGDRDREDREREEREERRERAREEREENEVRDDREDEERREVEVRRRRELREEGDRPRREGDRPDEVRRDRGDQPRREGDQPGEFRRIRERAVAQGQQRQQQAQQQQQQQARQQLERAREQLERQMAEMRVRLGERVRGAEERGEREVVEAVRREMEAANRQAEEQMRALERQREDLAARFRDVDRERATAERNVAEQERMTAMRSRSDEERQQVREMAAMVKELRQEVQQLRREVRELREGTTRKDAPKKDQEPKGEASLILESVPYVGRLFPKEKQPKKADPKPKVSVEFDGKKVEGADLKLELKLQGNDLQNLQKDLEKLQKVYADQIKAADIEIKKVAVDKLNDVKVELKTDIVKKLKDVQVEFEKAPVKDVKVELKKSPIEFKNVEIEFKKAPGEKIKDVEIEFKKAPVEKTKDAVIEFKKSIVDEVKKAELDVKKAIDKLKSDDLAVLKDRIASDVNVQYAAKAAQVAKMELEKALEATRKVPGAISDLDIEQMKHVQKRALLEVERAKQELLEQTSKLKDDLKSQTLQDDLAKRLSELKRMVELSTAKDKISKDKEPQKVIKEEKVEIKVPTK